MATIKISALPSAVGIDGTADFIPIVQSSVTNKINRATFLGITGAPLGTSDSQTVSNKTIGNSNAITIKDGSFTLQNTSDTTKQGIFSLANVTTGNTRTYTLPNASVTLASLTGTETLTNKAITSPTITGGTIDNSTITVDSISGHSTSTIVTVANLQISNGVLNSANAVTATSIAVGAVQPQALVTGTGSGWAWQSFSPTLANLTLGNGTLAAKYIQMGKTVYVRIKFALGNTSAVGTGPNFTLPVTPNSAYSGEDVIVGWGLSVAGGVQAETAVLITSTTVLPFAVAASNTYLGPVAAFSSSVPGTWGTNDFMHFQFIYEAA